MCPGGDDSSDGGVPAGPRGRDVGGPPPGADERHWWALQAVDAERRRIAGDLHDGAQQRLTALRVGISLAAELIAEDPAEAVARLERLGDEVEAALAELHELALGIYPPTLASGGLGDALSEIARQLPVPVKLVARGVRRYPELVENAVYFTCREALQNAVKHAAGGDQIDVTLTDTGTWLTFEVADNGCGFDADAPSGVGFQSMRSRIAAAGGELTIPAATGAGTCLRGSVPVSQPPSGLDETPATTEFAEAGGTNELADIEHHRDRAPRPSA